MSGKNSEEKHFDKILGMKLREYRQSLKVTQQTAIDMSGGNRQWLGKVESGQTTPSVFSLCKYACSAGINVCDLLDDVLKDFLPYVSEIKAAEENAKLKKFLQQKKKHKG